MGNKLGRISDIIKGGLQAHLYHVRETVFQLFQVPENLPRIYNLSIADTSIPIEKPSELTSKVT